MTGIVNPLDAKVFDKEQLWAISKRKKNFGKTTDKKLKKDETKESPPVEN